MSPVSPGAYCRDGGSAMTLRRIAAEVTQDQWDLIARLQTRAPELRCVAPVRTGAWAWVEAQPDNDQSGLQSAVIQ